LPTAPFFTTARPGSGLVSKFVGLIRKFVGLIQKFVGLIGVLFARPGTIRFYTKGPVAAPMAFLKSAWFYRQDAKSAKCAKIFDVFLAFFVKTWRAWR